MQQGSLVADRFVIERRAGAGAAGVVYRARDRHTGAIVALKTLHRAALDDRFVEEARILAEIYHPGVVRYVAHGRTATGAPYLAMEWIDGEGLDARIARGPLRVAETIALATRVGEALAAAHARGVVHRDLKPSNLLLPDGDPARAMIIDFGLALGARAARGSQPGAPVGTPGYMSPEQVRGQRDVDARTDVFSLGCVMFECLTGQRAFAGEHPMGVLAKVLLEEPPRASEIERGVPAALDDLVARMLAKDRALRPEDAARVVVALAAIEGPSPPARASRPPRSRSLGVGEQRLLSVAVTGPSPSMDLEGATAPTLLDDAPDASVDALASTLSPFAPRLEKLADGTVVATLSGAGAATDQAVSAARCALAMRDALPDRAIALATGRGVIAGRLPIGEVIDRAARMLGGGPRGSIRIDDLTAGLLDPRFVVGGDDEGLALFGEREIVDASRSLLGRPSPCVGRDREIARLRVAIAESAAQRSARAILVVAPAGTGKSRLRRELVSELYRSPGARPSVLFAQGAQGREGAPFGVLAPAIRRAAGVLDAELPNVQRQKLRAWSTRHIADGAHATRVAVFLGELAGVPFADDASAELHLARRDAVLMGDQMRRAFEDLLAIEGSLGPVLIVVDDLQWADRPSVAFLGGALMNLARAPLVVLAFARPEVHEVFPALWAEHCAEVMTLDPLPRAAAIELAQRALDADRETAAILADRAAGNAYYLEELIRHVARLGLASSAHALPQTVLAMVEARLGTLEPEARRVLRAASVFGLVVPRRGVAALLGDDDPDRVEEELDDLEAREILARRADGELAFRSALVRDTAYATLTESDRALGHRLAGAFLEALGEPSAITLAEHFVRGGEPERAAVFFRRAAGEALHGNDFEGTIALVERGIEALRGIDAKRERRLGGARPMELGAGTSLGGSPHELAGALRAIAATAHRFRGRNAEARAAGLEAITALPQRSASWYLAAAEIAIAAMKLGDTPRLEEIGEALRDLAERGERGADHAIACARVATQLLQGGRRELADALFACLDDAAGAAHGDPAVEARRAQARAIRALFDGDLEDNVALMDASARAFEAAGDLRNAHIQRVNTMFAKLEIGAYEEVEHAMRAAVAGADRMGLAALAALARVNLGMALRARGALAEARACEIEAARAFAAQGDRRMEGAARNNLAIILADEGDLDRAETEARAAIETLADHGPARAYAQATLARVMLAKGDPFTARALAGDARLAALGGIEEGESAVLLAHAEALHATGDLTAARVAIAGARTRLLARAERISDPLRRATFLRRVEDNARTLSLARTWLGEDRA